MQRVELIFPTQNDKERVLKYLQEFKENGEEHVSGGGSLEEAETFENWLEKIQKDTNEVQEDPNRVPSTQYLAINKENNELIGMIQIRHELNEYLLNYGGHIGYSVRPSKRQKGYAKEMLALALGKCKKMNLSKVLITCNEKNIASARTILANGGILENKKKQENGVITNRYWITI